MKVKAAVAHKAGAPLEIETVDLDGPRAGEVLVEIKATGICHTDEFTLSGADPEGLFPAILGHEGAGIVVEVGAGRDRVQEGRPRHPALHAGMPAMPVLPVAQDQSVHRDPRHPGPGRDAGRHQPVLGGGQKMHHYMGCSTFANFTVLPEIAVAKIREDAPFDKVCYIGCGVTTGIGAVINTAKVEAGARCVVFGLGGIGLNVIQGAAARRRRHDHRRRPQPGAKAWGERFGMTHFVNPEGGRRRPRALSRRHDRRRRPTTPSSASAMSTLMRQALECCHRGWGQSDHHRRRRRGPGDLDAAVPARHRPGLEGHGVRRRARPHRRAEDRRLVHGRQNRDRPT